MKIKYLIVSSLLVFFAVALPTRILAQDGTPPAVSAASWKGEVTGSITNGTPDTPLPEKLDVMLHGWNETEEKIMLHGQSAPDGSFRFSDVDFDPGLYYSVMATYKDVSYVSEPVQVQEGDLTLSLNARVYETTTDLSRVKIDQMHVLFYAHEGQLMVTEVVILSNLGNLTVKDALSLPSGRKGSLKYPLPEEATNVEFDTQSTDRFIQVAGGFVDSAPIVPGEKSSQVMVNYSLPYTSQYTFDFTAPVAIDGLSFLIPADSGVELKGNTLISAGTQPMQDGSTFTIYTAPGLAPGESITISLKGKLNQNNPLIPSSQNFSQGIAVGGSLLGLALLGVGFWWWRRTKEKDAEVSLEEMLAELEQLDAAYARGEVSEKEYQESRTELQTELEQAESERDHDDTHLT